MKKILSVFMIFAYIMSTTGCDTNKQIQTGDAGARAERTMTLATTTSTQDSGLLDYLLPQFKKDTGIKVKVVAMGTGAAIELGKRGDADCLLVHAKEQEEQFINDGYGVRRFDVCYNDFIIVGPREDPAKLSDKSPNDPVQALGLILDNKSTFISRGDESGTHTKEKGLWKSLNLQPSGNWYVSAGKGMGEVLKMADEKKAYTLADRATYLSMKDQLELDIMVEKNSQLYNQYGVIAVNPAKFPNVKEKEANEFVEWILSDPVQKLIGEYGKDKYGQSLFIPNASKQVVLMLFNKNYFKSSYYINRGKDFM